MGVGYQAEYKQIRREMQAIILRSAKCELWVARPA